MYKSPVETLVCRQIKVRKYNSFYFFSYILYVYFFYLNISSIVTRRFRRVSSRLSRVVQRSWCAARATFASNGTTVRPVRRYKAKTYIKPFLTPFMTLNVLLFKCYLIWLWNSYVVFIQLECEEKKKFATWNY